MLTRTYSSALDGINGTLIEVEGVALNSIPQIQLTGLAGEVVKESRERVQAALTKLGYDVPSSKILVHLSPATTKKIGSHYDLAIAISILGAEGKLESSQLSDLAFIGELSLDGRLKPVAGALSLIEIFDKIDRVKSVIIPKGNDSAANLINSKKVKLAGHISEVIDYLNQRLDLPCYSQNLNLTTASAPSPLSLDQVTGQNVAKRALQIALAGRHHLLLVGPPGVGKSMLSHCAAGLLPPMDNREQVEVAKIFGATQLSESVDAISLTRPFRSPHHTISAQALLGGGSGVVRAGEVSLAHNGILFLDEFPEFRREAIEGLREPMQTGNIHLHRVGKQLSLPSRFMLIAAMNPCPCGNLSNPNKICSCSSEKRASYHRKVSAPILDRFGLILHLDSAEHLNQCIPESLSHLKVRESIKRVYDIQRERYKNSDNIRSNSEINSLAEFNCFALQNESSEFLDNLIRKFRPSFRGVSQIIKVARTIADLEEAHSIELKHLTESWSLRCTDLLPRA